MYNGAATFTITSQPFYNQYSQCYTNILTLNIEPQGPLRKIVRRIKFPKLSPFQIEGPCYKIQQCGLALRSLTNNYNNCNNCDLMSPDEIPDLITFLTSNGYQIETQITNMLNQSEVRLNNKKIVFNVTYYGNKQPNITYIR
jgi:hypothetical protein